MFNLHFDTEKILGQLTYNAKDPLLFNSGFFLFFFLVFLLGYQFLYKKKISRVIYFTIFSLYFFYKACGFYFLFIILSAVIDFNLSNWLYRAPTQRRKKLILLFSIVINLGLLFYFKYTNFFIDIYNDVANGQIKPLKLILPIGISFYTFENLSYTIDVYRGKFKPVTSFLDYCFFLSFFPKLVMGPIVRASDFIPQIRKDILVTDSDVARGLYLILGGLFKKVVISDFIYVNFVQYIFDDPSRHSGIECLLGVYGYAMVIYCDFSGYSDMAIGMGRMFGFRFLENFNYPIISQSMKEFWTRWHISLSNFFRDYVYLPLGGNKKGKFRMYLSLWTIFLLNGIWHGPNWNFLLFGVYHGAWLTLERLGFSRILEMFPRWLRSFYVFLAFAFGNIIFSIEDLHHIGTFYRSLFNFSTIADPFSRLYLYTSAEFYFIIIIGSFLFFPCVEYVFKKIRNERIKPRLEAGLLIVLFILSLSELANSSYNPFIYFRF